MEKNKLEQLKEYLRIKEIEDSDRSDEIIMEAYKDAMEKLKKQEKES